MHTHPGALQELASDVGSTQQLAPGLPGLLTLRCKLLSFSWSPDPQVALEPEQLTPTRVHSI